MSMFKIHNPETVVNQRITQNTIAIGSTLELATKMQRYVDSVPTGNSATAVYPVVNGYLGSIKVWFAIPLSGLAVILVRLYRYRKVNGVFTYTLMNDPIVLNSSTDWSTVGDYSSTIRNIDVTPDDMIAVATNYTLNGSPNTIRALKIVTTLAPSPPALSSATLDPPTLAPPIWPPP